MLLSARLVALTCLLAAPLSWGYGVHTAAHSIVSSRVSSSSIVALGGKLTLKEKVVRAKMAAKGRHRLCVFKSNKHIYAQVVDDLTHNILAAASSVEPLMKDMAFNKETCKVVGMKAAERAKEKGVELVYFDRNGFKYHGRVAAVADGAREAGLVF
ncbi:hypothetical protein T492DRAFT_507941 [Pavlovales sp. CCMP2436]|nr:hypothetical protein T492DRAFT_507941 [Pavlovales sp. CCMP2436]|mmetsp:Transcript_39436/g.92730  ORF Transcript_39436/g.92730 Transcript_39436/m.92730 type:complete len:156 (+) Transcript_39436:76-543(+)